ncbi:MAG: diadenylate cyclase CdaA [Cyanobacteria bacterium J06639_1]
MWGPLRAWLEYLTPLVLLDWAAVVLLITLVLFFTRKTRAAWLIRGFVILIVLSAATQPFPALHQLIDTLALGGVVALAVLFQPELRKVLERLGRGDWLEWVPTLGQAAVPPLLPEGEDSLDCLLQAVKELSQNRTGALVVIESTDRPIDPLIYTDRGVTLDSKVSRELLLTIFQTSTLLHDGAVVVKGDRIQVAGAILPMSERAASRQLGTRHRAAMGITEQADCLCVVVSEETGSISLAEGGRLERPLTSSKLEELLVQRLRPQLDPANGSAPWLQWVSRRLPDGPPGRLLSVLRNALSKE